MDHGQWTMDNGPWTMDLPSHHGQWTKEITVCSFHGQWTMDNGLLQIRAVPAMDNGPWTMDYCKYGLFLLWTMDHGVWTNKEATKNKPYAF